MDKFKKSLRTSTLIASLALIASLLASTLIYWPGLNSPLQLDDYINIESASIDKINATNLISSVTKNRSGIHPITRAIPTITFSIQSTAGIDRWQLKYQNLMLHLLCGVFIFLFIYLLAGSFNISEKRNLTISLLTTVFWLIHPLHVSTTLYAIQRITQLSTLFTLISLCIFLYAKKSTNQTNKLVLYFCVFPITLILSLMSKENSALICVYLITLSYIVSKNPYLKNTKIDKIFCNFFGWATLTIGIAFFTYKAPNLMYYGNRDFTLIERLLTQIHVITGYIQNLLVPKLSSMGLFLDDQPIQKSLDIKTSIKLISLLATIIASCVWVYQRKFIGVLFIFFLGHTMESTVIALEVAFEHRNYFPSIGIFACLSWFLTSTKKIKTASLVSSIIIINFASLLFLRVDFWSDEHEWQKTNLTFHPKSLRTHISYKTYLEKHYGQKAAIDHIKKAEKLIPNSIQLPIIQLGYYCLNPESNIKDERLINKVSLLTHKKAFTIQIENALYQLTELIEKKRCRHINTQKLFELINQIINDSKTKNFSVGNLYAARALLLHSAGHSEQAKNDFVTAYKRTGQIGHLIPAAETLMANKETHDKGIQFIKEINNGNYFNIELHQSTHKKINDILNEYPQKK